LHTGSFSLTKLEKMYPQSFTFPFGTGGKRMFL
jgi:hypothetical protein